MSLFDDASLAMIPSAYKDGKLYSIKPTDGSGDFTFTRGSNLAATRVDVNGLIEKGRENLLLQSNQFDTTWTTSNANVTGGQSGYDGSSDAWLLEKSASLGYLRQTELSASAANLSIFVKANDSDYVLLAADYGTRTAYFDLQSGVVGHTSAGVIAKILFIGDGWYRCSATFGAISDVRIYPAENNLVTASSGSVFIQDAQLEQGLVATDYIETTTTTAQAGILEDMPRLDYSGGASCPSLLLEPQRTNVVTNSEYFGASDWIKSRSVVSANTTISPSGIQDAETITENTFTNNFSGLEQEIAVVNGTTYTQSIFVKRGNIDFFSVGYFIVGGANGRVIYNLNTKLVTLSSNITSSSITDFANGWVRISITYTANASSTNYFAYFHTKDSGTTYYNGDGTGFTHVWGAQLESNASYPSSYIPTYGTSQTRSKDSCIKTGISSLIGQTEGTLFVEFTPTSNINTEVIQLLADTALDNIVTIACGAGFIYGVVYTPPNYRFQPVIAQTIPNNTFKVALCYKNNDFTFFINGVKVASGANSYSPSSPLTRINFNEAFLFGNQVINYKSVLVFPVKLTDAELAALTTL